jgi:predicted 3-demethylubiquinone-9 3-methyltransferase (glyoxalase superfamily)
MQKITPHLWFDKEAKEAAEAYVSIFGKDSKIKHISRLDNTPSGSVDLVAFELLGQEFQAISAGPLFKFNPSVSFHVKCDTPDEVDAIWERLSQGGTALMELGAYPFSERYGWVQDKYGLTWQLIYSGGADVKQRITPVIMFVGDVCGKAEEAINFWTSLFQGSKVDAVARFGKGEEPDQEGTLKYASFSLSSQEFVAMDSAHQHTFGFNEAISLIVHCNTQEEIDGYWNKLSAVPEAEQCGWLKDKYGFSWQIVPTAMDEMMRGGSMEQIARLTEAFLQMKKFDIESLKRAYQGGV